MEQLFTNRKFHFCYHRNFRVFFVNGKRPQSPAQPFFGCHATLPLRDIQKNGCKRRLGFARLQLGSQIELVARLWSQGEPIFYTFYHKWDLWNKDVVELADWLSSTIHPNFLRGWNCTTHPSHNLIKISPTKPCDRSLSRSSKWESTGGWCGRSIFLIQ